METQEFNWKKVKSSQIDAVTFVVKEQALYIRFIKGAIWKYTPFSFQEYGELINAESVGRYFHSEIKNIKEAKRIS